MLADKNCNENHNSPSIVDLPQISTSEATTLPFAEVKQYSRPVLDNEVSQSNGTLPNEAIMPSKINEAHHRLTFTFDVVVVLTKLIL